MTRSSRLRLAGALVAGAAALAPSTASAQNVTVADSLFRDGQRLLREGKTHEACEKLAESNRLDPQLGTLLNLAVCHEQEQRTATAWSDYNAVVEEARRRGDSARIRYAQAHAATLERSLSRVALELEGGVELGEVKVDGQALGKAAWSSPLPLDPGDHALELSAPGKVTRLVHLALARGPITQTVHVGPLEDRPAEPPSVPLPAPAPTLEPAVPTLPPPVAPPAPEATGGGTRRVVMLASAGVAVVGAGVGAAFGISAIIRKSSDVDAHCQGSVCTPQALDAVPSVRNSATASDVAFAVAGAGLVAAAIAFVFLPRDTSPVQVVGSVGASSAGLGLRGAW